MSQSHPLVGCTPVRSTRDFGLGRLSVGQAPFAQCAPVRSIGYLTQTSEGLWFFLRCEVRSMFGSGNGALRAKKEV